MDQVIATRERVPDAIAAQTSKQQLTFSTFQEDRPGPPVTQLRLGAIAPTQLQDLLPRSRPTTFSYAKRPARRSGSRKKHAHGHLGSVVDTACGESGEEQGRATNPKASTGHHGQPTIDGSGDPTQY